MTDPRQAPAEPWRFKPAHELTDDELREALSDPNWRLRNLYYIIDKNQKRVLFSPWPEQAKFIRNLWYRNVVLKARQRGFSTAFQIVMLDACLFVDNTAAAVIAQDEDAATKIFRKVRYAYDNLLDPIKAFRPLAKSSETEIILTNNSTLSVATSARSQTLNWLHVSEFGKICAKFPLKAQEVISGSLPAVTLRGVACVESTAEGMEGAFYEMCETARQDAELEKRLSPRDYRFHFAAWWDADEYQTDPEFVTISKQDHQYFNRLEANLGIEISLERRAWYVATRRSEFQGDKHTMFREYPSSPDEAFQTSLEGVYLAEELTAARLDGRITTVPYNRNYPVNTWWDLGNENNCCLWFHQRIGLRDHWIRFMEGRAGWGYDAFVREMNTFGYVWGGHYLPHDGAHHKPGMQGLKTAEDMLYDLGLRNIHVVPKTTEKTEIAIPALRADFSNYWFDETECDAGIKHLNNWKRTWNQRLGAWMDPPQKNGHDHGADALMQKAQMFLEESKPQRKRKRPGALAA